MDNPDPRNESKQTVLRRLLRRRGRASKTRANSGEPVKSWGEYSKVVLHPTGSPSPILRWVVVAVAFAFLVSLAGLIIGSMTAAETRIGGGLHVLLLFPLGLALLSLAQVTFSASGEISPLLKKVSIATTIVFGSLILIWIAVGLLLSTYGLLWRGHDFNSEVFIFFGFLAIVAGRIIMEILD